MFKEPLAVFTATADFGEIVHIDGQPVAAVFDREYAADAGFGLSVANADPQLWVSDAALPPGIKTAEVVARGRRYAVAEIEADGTGMAVIQLRAKHDTPAY